MWKGKCVDCEKKDNMWCFDKWDFDLYSLGFL